LSKQLAAWAEPISFGIPGREHQDDNPFAPLEYAFHLLGPIQGKKVVVLGCGDGLAAAMLAARGANVVAIDNSQNTLELTRRRAVTGGVAERVLLVRSETVTLPVDAASVDGVFASAILHRVDPLQTARQIRRVLKPGGMAVFQESITGLSRLAAVKTASLVARPLTRAEVEAVCRAVGLAGRRRAYWLASRLSSSKVARRLDAMVLKRFPFVSRFASPLVWEARKET
jgi:ubiquinone/menaquinone biosynthesis C-methylase UbiE